MFHIRAAYRPPKAISSRTTINTSRKLTSELTLEMDVFSGFTVFVFIGCMRVEDVVNRAGECIGDSETLTDNVFARN